MKAHTLFVPDAHCPWHHRAKTSAVLKWAAAEKPQQVILLGDVVDYYILSRFSKSNTSIVSPRTVRRERAAGRAFVQAFSDVSPKPLIYIRGNHEARAESRLGDNPLLAWYTGPLLPPGADKVRYIASGELLYDTPAGRILVCHGWRAGSLPGSGAASIANGRPVVQGHSHKLALIWKNSRTYAVESGYLGDPNAPCFEYCAGLKSGMRDWTHGFAWLDTDGEPHIERV